MTNAAYKFHEFIHAIDSEPAPCELYQCRMRKVCQQQHVACFSFYWYVSRGRVVNPHVTHIEGHRPHVGPILPSRHFYQLAMQS